MEERSNSSGIRDCPLSHFLLVFSLPLLAAPRLLDLMQSLPHTRSCFVCGELNPIGLNLRFETDNRIVQTVFVPRDEHAGFKQTVHGGIISTLLDETMVWVCAVQTKRFAFCAELTVRFLHPLRPHEKSVAVAELVANKRGKIFEARADLRNHEGKLVASATGKYLPIPETDANSMAADLVGSL